MTKMKRLNLTFSLTQSLKSEKRRNRFIDELSEKKNFDEKHFKKIVLNRYENNKIKVENRMKSEIRQND